MIRFLVYLALISLIACARLDDNLYNPSKLSEYKFDNYGQKTDINVPDEYDIDMNLVQLINLISDDGETRANIKGLFIGDQALLSDPNYKVILYCHGTRDHMDYYWPRTKLIANVGGKNQYGIMTLDYRGYGMSEGKPTEKGLYADVNAAIEWLQANGLSSERLFIYGFSLGSAPAVELSVYPRLLTPQKVILEAPFASTEVMVQDATLLDLPGSYVTNTKVDNATKIKKMTQPLLWLHGTDDDFISIKTHGEIVFKNHPGPDKTAIQVRGGTHTNVPQVLAEQNGSYDYYLSLINTFISE